MFNLVVVPNNSGNFGVGHFNSLEAAKAAQEYVHERLKLASSKEYVSVTVTDDYGSVIDIPASYISYTAIIDVQRKSEAQIESKLAEAKANKYFQERLSTSKDLQLLSRFVQAQQQPQIIQMAPQAAPEPSTE